MAEAQMLPKLCVICQLVGIVINESFVILNTTPVLSFIAVAGLCWPGATLANLEYIILQNLFDHGMATSHICNR